MEAKGYILNNSAKQATVISILTCVSVFILLFFSIPIENPEIQSSINVSIRRKFDPANSICCGHAKDIVRQWKKANNITKFENLMPLIEDFMFDNTVGSDNITQEFAAYLTDFFKATLSKNHKWPQFIPYQRKYQEEFKKNIEFYKKLYPHVNPKFFSCQIQAEHHSLRDADQRIKDYIRERDIVDIGSFVGDSMLVLHSYTDKRVFCFEVSSENYNQLKVNANTVGPKVQPRLMGLGSKEYTIEVIHSNGTSREAVGGEKVGNKVNVTTLDKVSKDLGMKIGLIKADVEGMAYDIMLGAKEAIARDRPVLALLVYHNYDEFHGIPQLLKEIGGYIFEYRGTHSCRHDLSEGQLFAIPQEVYYPNYY